jgi:demethylmenaquinone methyltransferase/2-methoxy-6-polyprenyl-1,4-benzoquinol methylase
MFDTIAPRYELCNKLMTFGLDGHWRQKTINLLATPPRSLVADLGAGTGDLARALRARGHRALAIDLSMGMLQATRADSAPRVLADAAMIPLPDKGVDAAVSGFALRNFSELHAVVVEIARVVRPGGRIALLEVALPESFLMKAGHALWFNHVVPRIGAAFSDAAAYRYLPASVQYLPNYGELAAMLSDAGFTSMRRDLLSGGVVQVVTATRGGLRASASRAAEQLALASSGANGDEGA